MTGPFHTLLLNFRTPRVFYIQRKDGESKEREKRKKGMKELVIDLVQPCVFLVKTPQKQEENSAVASGRSLPEVIL